MSTIRRLAILAGTAIILSAGVTMRADADDKAKKANENAAKNQDRAQKQVDQIRQNDAPVAKPSSKSAEQISKEQNKIPAAQTPQSFKHKSTEPPSPGK